MLQVHDSVTVRPTEGMLKGAGFWGTSPIEGGYGEQRDKLKDTIAFEWYFLDKNEHKTLAVQGQPQFKGSLVIPLQFSFKLI